MFYFALPPRYTRFLEHWLCCGDDVATVGLNLDSQTLQRFSSGLCCYGDGWFGISILASVWQFIFIFLVLFSDHQNPVSKPLSCQILTVSHFKLSN